MHQDKFETLARGGYAARGVVYLLLGLFTLTSGLWGGGESEDTSSALSGLLALPFGRILFGLVAVGLLGYVLWKLAQGFLNADHAKDDAKGMMSRAGHLVSAGTNIFLLLTAAKLAWNGGASGGGNGEESASAWVLEQPFGRYLLALIAIGVIAAALVQIWYGASGQFRKRLTLPNQFEGWMDKVCRVGLIARGVVIAIVGGFVAMPHSPFRPNRPVERKRRWTMCVPCPSAAGFIAR